ncbi:MAG: hypothetical protein AUH81_00255 [Candidatus Rokubacteria bacterium 13_1_40CM_4_69_5]|nr:MAG: hypothetical protein AUH81_00255 [Candidatus Rokubacteria bacterium 13_1_40CM_4_69_5]
MSRRSFAGLAVSVLLHGALVLAVALVIPRADRLPALFIDLTEDAGERGAGDRVSAAPVTAPARQVLPSRGRQLRGETSQRPAVTARPSAEAVAETSAAESSRPVEPWPPSAETPSAAPAAPPVSAPADSAVTATSSMAPGVLDGSAARADAPHGERGDGSAPAALARDGRSAGFGAGPGREVALAVPGGGAGDRGAAYSGYLAHLRQRIQEALRYPAAARRRGLAGTVTLELTILPNGAIGPVSVIQSSAHPMLDEAAVETVRSLRAHPFPAELPARTLTVRLPVVFGLQ